jgi:hypothetical protein
MKPGLREKYSRPPLDRMRRIHEWISGAKFPNAVTMGKDLEVTDRTVKRDIEFMRGRYGLPISYTQCWLTWCGGARIRSSRGQCR